MNSLQLNRQQTSVLETLHSVSGPLDSVQTAVRAGISSSSASNLLRGLTELGYLSTSRDGRRILYAVVDGK
jgi:DNA-binding IclR family transcriptional regulator